MYMDYRCLCQYSMGYLQEQTHKKLILCALKGVLGMEKRESIRTEVSHGRTLLKKVTSPNEQAGNDI
jgi:hypothetical protein